LSAGASAPRAGAARATSKKKNPRYQEAFRSLRQLMREVLQEGNFKKLIAYIEQAAQGRQVSLTPAVLDKILQGVEDYRTKEILVICSEYVRSAIKRRGKTSGRFDAWVNKFATPEQATPIPELTLAEKSKPATPQPVASGNGAPSAVGQDEVERPNGSAVSWLLSELDQPVAASETSTGWPVSLAATVGLDRTSQITICVGCNVRSLLKELQRVEEVLKSVDKAGRFPPRTWSIESGWLAESATEASVIELSDSDLAKFSKDTVEGVVQRHFERHSSNPTSSLVLASPASAASAARRIASVLRDSVDASRGSVQLLKRVEPTLNGRSLRSADTQYLDLIRGVDAMKATDQEVLAQARTPRLQTLLRWLSGKTSDENFFGQLTPRDLKLVIFSGRLGLGNDRPAPNAIHRSASLLRAAAGNPDLLYALGSLPIEPEIVEAMIHSPVHVRAVAGLITKDEMLAVPAPWFQKPIDTWRHGRGLSVGGGKRNGCKQRPD